MNFTDEQRKRLQQLDLTDVHIQRLEFEALPAAANYFKELANRSLTRKRLTEIRRACRKRTRAKREDALSRLLRQAEAADEADPLRVALRHVAQAEYAKRRCFDQGNDSLEGLARFRHLMYEHKVLEEMAEAAQEFIPREQRRRREADPGPAREILYVVEPMGVTLSTNPTSQFWEIVGICYEVLQGKQHGFAAERAIKALAKWDKSIS